MPELIVSGSGTFRLAKVAELITIGRAEHNELSLPDPQVSRDHAVLVKGKDGKYFVRDLSSTKGTTVDGCPVCSVQLSDGCVIGIGLYKITYCADPAPSEEELIESVPAVDPEAAKRATMSYEEEAETEELCHQFVKEAARKPFIDLMAWALDALLRAHGAEKGFIGKFKNPGAKQYDIIAKHGFEAGEKIQFHTTGTQPDWTDAVLQGRTVGKAHLIISPISVAKSVEAFLCLDRRPQDLPFLPANIEGVSLFTRLIAQWWPGAVKHKDDSAVVKDERLTWPERCVWTSQPMKKVDKQIRLAAKGRSNVLLFGETGSGKGFTAKAIHDRTNRKFFADVYLTNVPELVAESELFGHEKGAFTGAHERRIGKFETAGDGTLFLDEIGELSDTLQSKLLKAIENRTFSRLGSNKQIELSAQIIAATNKSPTSLRPDLYQRLKDNEITIPPLRERKEEIPVLVHYYLDKPAKPKDASDGARPRWVSRQAMDCLLAYNWPGNVRELEKIIEAFVVKGKEVLFSFDLPHEIQQASVPSEEPGKPATRNSIEGKKLPLTDEEAEKANTIEVLEYFDGNIAQAGRFLGIARKTLTDRMDKYGIPRPNAKSKLVAIK